MDESKVIPTLIVPPKHHINHLLVDAKFKKTLIAANEEMELEIKQLLSAARDTQVRSKIYLLEIKRMETACRRLLDIEIEVWCKLQGNPVVDLCSSRTGERGKCTEKDQGLDQESHLKGPPFLCSWYHTRILPPVRFRAISHLESA